MTEVAEEKRRLRASMRELRRSLDAQTQRLHANQLRGAIQHQSWYKSSVQLACYQATDGEISLDPLIALSWSLDKKVYLPVIAGSGSMLFREYRRGDKLIPGRYGIAVPPPGALELDIQELDLALIPLVAFDLDGYRLGMGGGYYDRALTLFAGHALASRRHGPLRVGVAQSCQMQNALPRESWDVRLQRVVTESGPVGINQSD